MPGRFLFGSLFPRRRPARARIRSQSHRVGLNPTRTGILTILQRMGAISTLFQEVKKVVSRSADSVRTPRNCAGHRRRRHPAGDRRAAAGRARRLLRRRRDDDPDAEELQRKETDRIAAVSRCPVRVRRENPDEEDGMRIDEPAACMAARSTPTGTTASRCSAPSQARHPRGRDVAGMEAAAVSYPGFEADVASLIAG